MLKDDLIDTTYHLYFKHSNKKLNALLIYAKVKGSHPSITSFRILVPSRIKQIEDNYFERNFETYYPQYYKINPNIIKKNAIVLASNELVMSIVLGSLSIGKTATNPEYCSKLYFINRKDDAQSEKLEVYIKLYGETENIVFDIFLCLNR